MTYKPIAAAPNISRVATAPSVGIFWRMIDILVIDRSILDDAEPYGDCITHAAGHYERWQEWQALGATQLAVYGISGAYRIDRV